MSSVLLNLIDSKIALQAGKPLGPWQMSSNKSTTTKNGAPYSHSSALTCSKSCNLSRLQASKEALENPLDCQSFER